MTVTSPLVGRGPSRSGADRPVSAAGRAPRGFRRGGLALALALAAAAPAAQGPGTVEELRSTGGLPAHVVGRFRDPAGFQQAAGGDYYVFDRRSHSVHRITPAGEVSTLVRIGPEDGRLIGARAFHLGPGGRFAVADAPDGRERVQIFGPDGARIGGFRLPGRAAPRITLGALVLSGVASLQLTGRTIVMSQPETGGLVTEFSLGGRPLRTFGALRRTGHEADRDVHLALNAGLPLADPRGGYYFVFQAGVPVFRRYDRSGELVFERHVEGRELDAWIAALPAAWPQPPAGARPAVPVVPPTVRAAAVDPDGRLWIALAVPYVYVYDPNGDKVRTVRLRGAGVVEPASLAFAGRDRLLVTPGCYEFTVR